MYERAQNTLAKANATVNLIHTEAPPEETQMIVDKTFTPNGSPNNGKNKMDFV